MVTHLVVWEHVAPHSAVWLRVVVLVLGVANVALFVRVSVADPGVLVRREGRMYRAVDRVEAEAVQLLPAAWRRRWHARYVMAADDDRGVCSTCNIAKPARFVRACGALVARMC